ncbi:MAG: NADH-quinone oxidoreductase subunit N [Reichenbachiella sp.]
MNSFSHKIESIFGSFTFLAPEATLIAGAIFLALIQLIQEEDKYQLKTTITLVTLVTTGWMIACSVVDGEWMNGVLLQNHIIRVVKYFFLFIAGSILFYPNSIKILKRGEFHFMILMIVLGSFLIMQSANLLVFFISVELVSLSSYILISFNFEKRSFEAGIKYLLFGAMSSGLMLYGISLLYGMTGGLEIVDLFMVTSSQLSHSIWLTLALIFFFSGLFFKLALVPLHIWSPDVYEAGPTPVVAIISILPKVAILLFFTQFIQFSGLTSIVFDWQMLLGIVALLSMVIGNFSALKQDNAKRMMAYSSIAHSGFLVIGILVVSEFGFSSMLFYAIVYGFMNIVAFYFISIMGKNRITNISELAGIGRQIPLIGGMVTLIMIALVGLPPTSGFTAKLLIFSSLWEFYQQQGDNFLLWLFVVGIANAAVSLFYYLKIPYFMFIKSGDGKMFKSSKKDVFLIAIVTLLILLLFFKPELLLNLLNQYNFAS